MHCVTWCLIAEILLNAWTPESSLLTRQSSTCYFKLASADLGAVPRILSLTLINECFSLPKVMAI